MTFTSSADRPQETVDTVIVGGGAIGCAAAWWRAADVDGVVVLERGEVGHGASFGNAGHMTPSDALPLAAPGVVAEALGWALRRDAPFSLQWRPNRDYVRWLLSFARWSRRPTAPRTKALFELGRLSLELTRHIRSQSHGAFALRDGGVVNVHATEKGFERGLAMARALQAEGITATPLTAAELTLRTGYDGPVAGGVHYVDDALCSPFEYVTALADGARGRGVDIREGVTVWGVTRAGSSFAVATSNGTLLAHHVVVAAGAASAQLITPFDRKLPIIGGQGYSMDVALEPTPRMPMLFPDLRIAVSPIGGLTRFAGIMDMTASPGAGRASRARYLERVARVAFPHASRFAPQSHWSGTRSCTPDGLPIIDALDPEGRFIVAAGHNMLGMTLSAGTGRLVAERLARRPSAISMEPFALRRF